MLQLQHQMITIMLQIKQNSSQEMLLMIINITVKMLLQRILLHSSLTPLTHFLMLSLQKIILLMYFTHHHLEDYI